MVTMRCGRLRRGRDFSRMNLPGRLKRTEITVSFFVFSLHTSTVMRQGALDEAISKNW
jgi:hypothetical protein